MNCVTQDLTDSWFVSASDVNDEEAKEKIKSCRAPLPFLQQSANNTEVNAEDADMSKFFDSDFRDEIQYIFDFLEAYKCWERLLLEKFHSL